MCHPFLAPATGLPEVTAKEIELPLSRGELIPVRTSRALSLADNRGARPVVVLSDMFGCTPFYRHLASRIAVAGFDALLPNYFFRYPELSAPEKELAVARWRTIDERRALADLTAVLRHIADGYGKVGVLGFCLGGTFALDLASLAADIPMVTVAYYGFPEHPGYARVPVQAPMELVRSQQGPVLAFWGTADDEIEQPVVARYAAYAKQYAENFRHVLYEGAPHGFLAKSDLISGVEVSDPAGDSWVQTVEHFRKHL